jgi:hypothetical protein
MAWELMTRERTAPTLLQDSFERFAFHEETRCSGGLMDWRSEDHRRGAKEMLATELYEESFWNTIVRLTAEGNAAQRQRDHGTHAGRYPQQRWCNSSRNGANMTKEEFIKYFNDQYKDTEYHEQEFEAYVCDYSDSDPTDTRIRIYDNHSGSAYAVIRVSDIPEVMRLIAKGREPLYAVGAICNRPARNEDGHTGEMVSADVVSVDDILGGLNV